MILLTFRACYFSKIVGQDTNCQTNSEATEKLENTLLFYQNLPNYRMT